MTPTKGVRRLASIPLFLHSPLAGLTARILHHSRKNVAFKGMAKAGLCESGYHRLSLKSGYNQAFGLLSGLHPERLSFHAEGTEELKKHRGGIILTLHLGIADAGTWYLNQQGIKARTIVGAGKDGQNKESQWVAAMLDHIQCPYLTRRQGFMVDAIKAIQRGEWLVFHCDMNSPGEPASFFGHQTQIPAFGLHLAKMTNTPVWFQFGWQQGREHFLRYQPFDTNSEVKHQVTQLTREMENAIRIHPQHWIWHYNRWK